jgi:integrase
MARSPAYPFIVRKASIWHARLDIPADVRPAFGGKRVLSRSTKLTNADRAFDKAKPWIEGWKAEIDAARSGDQPLRAADITRRFLAEAGRSGDHTLIDLVSGFVAKVQYGLSESEWQDALVTHDLDPAQALKSLGGQSAVEAVKALTRVRTPFAARVDEFRTAHEGVLVQKTLYEYCIDIEKFAAAQAIQIETFERKDVQAFIDTRCGAGLSAKTVKKQLSAVRTYWTWLSRNDDALKARNPFDRIEWPKPKRKRLDPADPAFVLDEDDGPRFTPEQVCRLWEAAADPDLRDAIAIAAYTGGRREGVFSLHVNTVLLDAAIPHLHLFEKTEAGKRRVPIHPDIVAIIRRLLRNPQPDGYLFRGTENQIGSRSSRLGNPMARLLDELGFEKPGFGFHSIRRAFVDFLQQASVSELHAAKIVGHAVKTITYGLYAGRLPLDIAYRIMVETVKYPRIPRF